MNPPRLRPLDGVFFEEHLINHTQRGEWVRSKSEVIIADMLFARELDYVYERKLLGLDGKTKYPDFTIDVAESGLKVYWEHLGMLGDPSYRARWDEKLMWYREQGIVPVEEGGGPAGTLVTSVDDPNGGIDSQAIATLMDSVFE
jgi:hypothetical protein